MHTCESGIRTAPTCMQYLYISSTFGTSPGDDSKFFVEETMKKGFDCLNNRCYWMSRARKPCSQVNNANLPSTRIIFHSH